MYDTTPMPESKLPPIYIRKEHKRLKMDPSGKIAVREDAGHRWNCSTLSQLYPFCLAAARKKKKGHGETVIPPRSLFEKASMLKVRREGKDQKKNFSIKQPPFAKPLPSLAKPAMEAGQDNPEWLISEDWALLQVTAALNPPISASTLKEKKCLTFYDTDETSCYCSSGCETAAGAPFESDNRVSCPHT